MARTADVQATTRRQALVGVLLTVGFITFLTLRPTGWRTATHLSLCVGCGDYGAADLLLNILLFAPLGVLLTAFGARTVIATGIGLALSTSIEVAQFFVPGREPTLRDILTNSIGCGLGAFVATHLRDWLAAGRLSRIGFWMCTLCTLTAVTMTGTLHRFDPPTGHYYGHWVQRQGHLAPWTGTVVSASVGEIPFRIGLLPDSVPLRESLRDTARISVRGTAGPPTNGLGGIVAITTDTDTEAILVGPRGTDLVVHVRRYTDRWRLRAPEFVFRDALARIPPGAPLSIDFIGTPRSACVTVNESTSCVGRPAVGSAWRFAQSFAARPLWFHRLLDALTLAILVFPAALFAAGTTGRERHLVLIFLIATLPAMGWVAGLALPTVPEWLGITAALGSGFWLHRHLRR